MDFNALCLTQVLLQTEKKDFIGYTLEINVIATRELGKGSGWRWVYIPNTDGRNTPFFEGNCNFQKKTSRAICLISVGKSPAPCRADRMGWRRCSEGFLSGFLRAPFLSLHQNLKHSKREGDVCTD